MNLEDLKQLNIYIISDNTKAEILLTKFHMTNSCFQQYLKIMKLLNEKSLYNKLQLKIPLHLLNKYYICLSENCNNETNYTYYKKFINDVLNNIREGNIDYCFYIGQIKELLRFEPDLKVNLRDFYFEVML